jgi:hypothetical protein
MSTEIVIALFSLISTVVGGFGLKFMESLFQKGGAKFDDAVLIRKELRESNAAKDVEINDLRKQKDTDIGTLRVEIDTANKRYYEVLTMNSKLAANIEYLQKEHDEMKAENERLRMQMVGMVKELKACKRELNKHGIQFEGEEG